MVYTCVYEYIITHLLQYSDCLCEMVKDYQEQRLTLSDVTHKGHTYIAISSYLPSFT